MAYTLTNVSNTIISVHPFGPQFLKPGDSFSIELEDFNTHLVNLISEGFLSVSPPLPDKFFPLVDNQMINSINDLVLKLLDSLGAHTVIEATDVDATTKDLVVKIGCEVGTFDVNGAATTKFIEVASPKAVSVSFAVVANPNNKTINFSPPTPKFVFGIQTPGREEKFGASSNLISFDRKQSLLAGVIPPQVFTFSAKSRMTIDSAPFTGIQIKAVVMGFGAKVLTF